MNITGLSHKFTLTDGKFDMLNGTAKTVDNLWFFMSFIGWFRTYYEDYIPDLLWLIQKPNSSVNTMKVLLLGKLTSTITQYLPDVILKGLDFGYVTKNDLSITFKFSTIDEPQENIYSATFINIQ